MTRRVFRLMTLVPLMVALAVPVRADAVSDALQAALDAYNSGNLAKTSESLTMASQAMAARQSALLVVLMPPAPKGWTATATSDFAQGFGLMGGGAGAEMRYEKADQSQSFTLSFIADNPMVASMGTMLGNAQMMALMGNVVKIGNQSLLKTDDTLSTLINNRVLFQAQGAATDVMLPVVQTIDFAKAGLFDAK